jgi:FkbM family methyltransferase
MLSLRDLARTYLDYYKSGGVKYSLQNDAAILRAIESVLKRQFETPQVLLSHIEAALAQQTRDLRESVEWGHSVEQLKEALSKVDELRQQIGQLQRPSRLDEFADRQMRRQAELLLLGHLAPYLESNVAIDVGANTGDSAQALLNAGFSVFAFEPYPSLYQKLVERFAEERDFTAFDLAIGAADGNTRLKPSKETPNATTDDGSEVAQRTLESLQRSRQIPGELGVVKISAGGDEVQTILGLGSLRPSVIVAEFREEEPLPEGGKAFGSLRSLAMETRERGYKFNLAIYCAAGAEKAHFLSNTLRVPDGSRGNVFFFAEAPLFEKALTWCDVFL